MKIRFILLLSCLLPFGAFAQDQQVVPEFINYQGKLTDAVGAPLAGDAGGTFRLRFEIFAQAAGGEAVWAEERDAVVIAGIFNVALGGAGGAAVGEFPVDLGAAFEAPARFLETTVVSGPQGVINQTLAPRQQLASTPYALVSQSTERAAVATLAESLIPELMKALNPPGTVIAYAGAVTDTGGLIEPVPGYLLCNGAVIDGTAEDGKYAALRAALGNAWGNGGNGGNPGVVNVPDLRGVFLRGWNGSAGDGYADPDRTNRATRKAGGATGNSVGAFQIDDFKNHGHPVVGTTGALFPLAAASAFGQPGSYVPVQGGGPTQGSFGNNVIVASGVGGSETRGKNAYVAYLIKY